MTDKNDLEDSEAQDRKRHKKIEIAFILPALGIFLFLTPMLDAFTSTDKVSDPTQIIIYIFGLWAILILLTFCFTRWIRHEDQEE